MESSFAERLGRLDLTLFDPIPSQTTEADRRALLVVLRCFHERGSYRYLEVGSHLGGSLQIPYQDPACQSIQSIDPRPTAQADARLGGSYVYEGNSSKRMRALLRRLDPASETKLHCHDGDLATYVGSPEASSADLIFIDAEHTPLAMRADLERALQLQPGAEVVLMHDVEALVGHEPAIEKLATSHGKQARLLSPSLLALAPESFFANLSEIEIHPLQALAGFYRSASSPEPIEVRSGIIVATTLAATPDVLVAGLIARNPAWHDAGILKPAPPMPPAELTALNADERAIPVFREVFTPFDTAFSAARSRGLKMVFLLPSPEQVLDNLARKSVFPHSDSWVSVRDYLVPRLQHLVNEAQLASKQGPTWCLFNPVSESDIAALDTALAKGKGAVVGSPSALPGILTPPALSPLSEERLGPLPDHLWVAFYEAFEFAYNMVALTCARSAGLK